MNKKKSVSIIVGIVVIALVVVGVVKFKAYYNNRYVESDMYYARIPADISYKDSWLYDDKGEKVEQGYDYTLMAYNKSGKERKVSFSVAGTPDKLYSPGTYLEIRTSNSLVLEQKVIERSQVPKDALSAIENDSFSDISLKSQSTNEATADQSELLNQLKQLKDGDYTELETFVNSQIEKASTETADKMISAMLASSQRALDESMTYIYDEEGMNAMDSLSEVIRSKLPSLVNSKAICAEDKENLLFQIKTMDGKEEIASYLSKGLCLRFVEGSYDFDIDYRAYEQAYKMYVGQLLSDYLTIMSTELTTPITNEEFLAVSPDVLAARAISYETFLKGNTENNVALDVQPIKNLFLIAVYKLTYPSPFEGLANDDGTVTKEMLSAYQLLSRESECPVIKEVADSMLKYIEEHPGGKIFNGGGEDSGLRNYANKLYKNAEKYIKEHYNIS